MQTQGWFCVVNVLQKDLGSMGSAPAFATVWVTWSMQAKANQKA